ncbi:8-amino-7-oxononanoate synthase [Streptomyces sp. ISL-12]|uniref:8-amino-7-oxononanoate synthase n=1 Tax=Streptomyces sp. ISL-12 TaxID=2819177 RepID=UPI001BEC1452|nr:8-amino-7-oxononanoate synthase [Streptomyces sp. ISL-12]MBT2414994.1 8-amino-7-oxononanoate synthase [Streptomyces sp. ISL-12]
MAFDWIDTQRELRRRSGLLRSLRSRPAGDPLLDLASNDYLGLARHPEVTEGAARAARIWGGGATGSRLVTGSTELHAELEHELAAFCGFEAALVFSSGYAANLAAVTALAPHGSLLVSDAGNHASLIDGCRLARGTTQVVPHAAPDAVRKALRTHDGPAVVVSDTVFSVDGDAAPLTALAAVCRERGAGLLLDDAHGLGVLGDGGRGAPHAAGLAGAEDVVATVTLSKSLGSQGGAVLGPARVIGHLVDTARTFIFDTGLAPAAAGAALAALRLLRREPERAARARAVATDLHARLTATASTATAPTVPVRTATAPTAPARTVSARTAPGLEAVRPDAAVVSVRAPSSVQAVRWAADCRTAGLAVGCFRPPSVPDGISRLRLTARADLTEDQVERAVRTIRETRP